MRITVVGPGALGCLYAALLVKAGNQVWLLDHNGKRAQKINGRGVVLKQVSESSVCRVKVTCDPVEIGRTELLLLCVKSRDTLSAICRARSLLSSGTELLSLQNGIGHHAVLKDELADGWSLGVTAQGAALEGDGLVRWGGRGLTTVGFPYRACDSQESLLRKVVEIFNEAGLETSFSNDILSVAWNKLIVNAGINALTALYNCRNGELLRCPEARIKLEGAVVEAAAVAKAKGLKVADDPLLMTEDVCRATSGNISSMLQDIRHGRLTEIDAINGAVVRAAQELGISAPENERLVAGVKALENS